MPNESVLCPNCGSGDVQQLAADSYACEHCHTNFRWVNPTTSTVVNESQVCVCGNNAVAHCVRCREPLCKRHKFSWILGDREESDAHLSRMENNLRAEAIMHGMESRDSVRQVMKKHGLPDPESKAVLCEKCRVECFTTYQNILEAFNKTAEKGRACTICFSQSLRGQCSICKVWVCSQHGAECKKCHQIVCMQHIGGGGWCQTCSTQEIRQSEASKTIGGNIVDSLIYAVVLFMVFGFFGFVVGGFAGKNPLSSAGTAGKFGFLLGIIAGLIQGIIEYNRTIKGK